MRITEVRVTCVRQVCCRIVNSEHHMPTVLWAPYRGKFKAAEADIGSEAAAKVMHADRQSFTSEIPSNPSKKKKKKIPSGSWLTLDSPKQSEAGSVPSNKGRHWCH